MKELISAARIGRSLGVHLILATQKPSGQVNEQIWSNSKFRLCLKVQNKEDSNEVLKSPLAAEIKEPGRAYLQVGNNEIFELLQSGFSGALEKANTSKEKSYIISQVDISGRKRIVYAKKKANSSKSSRTQLEAIVDYVRDTCIENGIERLQNICLPPLPSIVNIVETNKGNGMVSIGIYDDPDSQYQGDDSIPAVRKDRDNRLFLFLKEPGQKNVLFTSDQQTSTVPIELESPIVNLKGRSKASATGYDLRKGLNFDASTCLTDSKNTTGTLVFRAVEAYLNYIEACYERTGGLDDYADEYWKQIRKRAGVDINYRKTIDATQMDREALNDWGAYSGGRLIDSELYNIRRERRCELMAEGLRNMDILRWRAMDQMINLPYHIEGFKLWGPVIQYQYPSAYLKYDKGNSSTVSSPKTSLYFRPYEVVPSSIVYNGLKWKMAHYLSPIAEEHFQVTSGDGTDVSLSPIYQNPGWPTKANLTAE